MTAFFTSPGFTVLIAFVFRIIIKAQLRKRRGKLVQKKQTRTSLLTSRLETMLLGRRATRCARISYDMVISLADGQLATGIALLVAAIKKLEADRDISVYHFNLVMNSVFLSSAAFTYAAISYRLRSEWEEEEEEHEPDNRLPIWTPQKKHHSKPEDKRSRRIGLPWTLRILLIVALDVLLLFSAWVSLGANGLPSECPASCSRAIPADVATGRSIWLITLFLLSAVVNIIVCLQLARVHAWWLPKVCHISNADTIERGH